MEFGVKGFQATRLEFQSLVSHFTHSLIQQIFTERQVAGDTAAGKEHVF